jgi:hypothetical protein
VHDGADAAIVVHEHEAWLAVELRRLYRRADPQRLRERTRH